MAADGVDHSLIGMEMEPFIEEIEKGAIRRFAEAIGATDPIHFDEDHARSKGYRGIVAPPTFAASFRPTQRQPWLADLDAGRILAGEQAFDIRRPVVAGDVLSCQMRLAGLEEKQGRSGKLQFIIQEMRASDPDGQVVIVNKRIIAYRSAGALKSS
jgi:acyl dehydratase